MVLNIFLVFLCPSSINGSFLFSFLSFFFFSFSGECHGSMSHEVLFQAGTILFPVEFWAEMGYPYCVISARDSLLFRMRFSRLFFVYLQSNMADWKDIGKFYL